MRSCDISIAENFVCYRTPSQLSQNSRNPQACYEELCKMIDCRYGKVMEKVWTKLWSVPKRRIMK